MSTGIKGEMTRHIPFTLAGAALGIAFVWLPCCISDIIFPLLFVKDTERAQV